MGWTRRTWLLLALSFLIVCIHADTDANTSATTISKSSEPGATSAVDSSVSSVSSRSTPAPPSPAATEKQTTRAPPTAPPPTTNTAAMTTNPQTTAKPTDPPSTKSSSPSAGGGATAQPSTPPAGGGAVRQTTIVTGSKSTEIPETTRPGTTAPTSNTHSTLPPPPPPSVSVKATTVLALAPPLTTGSPVQTSPPGSRTTVTVPQTTKNSGTTRATNVPAPSATGTTLIHATTKQDTKEVVSTSAAVTSKTSPSPDQRPTGPSRSTPPPTVPQRLERSTSASPSVVTAGGSRLDLVSVSTTESRDQTRDQTTDHAPVQTTVPFTTAVPAPRIFSYSLNKGHQSAEEKELVSLCQQLMGSLEDGNCTISFRHHNGKVLFDSAEITGKVKTTIVTQHFEDITKKPSDNRTLITILASCGALLIMIVILAVCASQHRKPYGNQMHLTEELQTVENGYHDNPTLEVMEVGVDMQEKKSPPPPGLNNGGDFNDSWIVPIDNLLKEEGPDEEDTHL